MLFHNKTLAKKMLDHSTSPEANNRYENRMKLYGVS